MRLAFLLAVACATPLAAQQTKDPSVAIRQAAITDTAQRLASYRVVADTAWATLVDRRDIGLLDPRKDIAGQEVRLERRGAAWARVSSRSVVVIPALHGVYTAPAKPFKLEPPPPRP